MVLTAALLTHGVLLAVIVAQIVVSVIGIGLSIENLRLARADGALRVPLTKDERLVAQYIQLKTWAVTGAQAMHLATALVGGGLLAVPTLAVGPFAARQVASLCAALCLAAWSWFEYRMWREFSR